MIRAYIYDDPCVCWCLVVVDHSLRITLRDARNSILGHVYYEAARDPYVLVSFGFCFPSRRWLLEPTGYSNRWQEFNNYTSLCYSAYEQCRTLFAMGMLCWVCNLIKKLQQTRFVSWCGAEQQTSLKMEPRLCECVCDFWVRSVGDLTTLVFTYMLCVCV